MDAIATLITLARLYAADQSLELTTVSWRLFGDSKKLGALIDGSDIQVRRYEQALRWLSENWPATVAWPSDIARPSGSDAATEAQPVVDVSLENRGACQ